MSTTLKDLFECITLTRNDNNNPELVTTLAQVWIVALGSILLVCH